MPMPPVINPYDPRKKQQQPAQQQPVQQPGQQQPAQPAQPAQPSQAVQSSLPPMQQPQQAPVQQQKKPAAPVTYQQQAGAVADPRFSQALAQKLQSDVAAKTAALQQQQTQFQEELNKASGGVPAQERISSLLGKITSGQASEAELSEYDKLQKMQYQGPTGLQGTANIAALSQLAGSPELLAQQYAGFAPGGVRPGDFAKAMAGLQKSPELASAQQAATGLAEKAMSAEEIAAQQAGLLKGQTEAAKTQAETAVKAEQEKYMAGLGEEAKSQIEAKKGALDKLKEGLFLTGTVSRRDVEKLGLDPNDPNVQSALNSLQGIDTREIRTRGISSITNVKDLEQKVQQIQNDLSAGNPVTPEEEKLATAFSEVSNLQRGSDEATGVAYAQKGDLAKINALRRLTGQTALKEEDIGKGAASGGISASDLSGLTGKLKELAPYSDSATLEEQNKAMLKQSEFNHNLGKVYNTLANMSSTKWGDKEAKATGKGFDEYIDSLEKNAKKVKDTDPNAKWLYDRLQKMKGPFGWDRKQLKKLAQEQQKKVQERKAEYDKSSKDYGKQLTERSQIARKVNLSD